MAFTEETVFYDVPDHLIIEAIPTPTTELAALPGYPNDANRLTLAARVYVPDPNLSGDGPYPTVIILHGSGGLWSNDVIANGLLTSLEELGELLSASATWPYSPTATTLGGFPEISVEGNRTGIQPSTMPCVRPIMKGRRTSSPP